MQLICLNSLSIRSLILSSSHLQSSSLVCYIRLRMIERIIQIKIENTNELMKPSFKKYIK